MEIVVDDSNGTDVLNGLPTITSEADLAKALAGGAEADTDEAAKEAAAAKPAAAAPKKKPAASPLIANGEDAVKNLEAALKGDGKVVKEGGELEEEEEEEAGKEGKEKERNVADYPSLVHYLNEVNELGLNLEGHDELTIEEQADALNEILNRVTQGTNKALSEYRYIETLLQDAEIKELLVAKSEGKTLKDVAIKYAALPGALDDDSLVRRDFKLKYPRASEEQLNGMVDSLKTNKQFEPFVKSLREQQDEDQRVSSEKALKLKQEAERAEVEQEKQQLQAYSEYLGGLNDVFGVPLTEEMKQQIFQATTERDAEGATYLDKVLQSNAGTVLATIGVIYLRDMIQNKASLEGNRKNAKLMNKLFDTADKLQSSSVEKKNKDEENLDLLNNF